ncbi:MAG: hypothetical protein SAJ12_20725 [Jaaginema sp. PMC 1079.18]|nr:hypothetical protein [Jaaginema sp. PMC 1080.18]MEC4853412.1 hypothetical protein [Jaaginema sp. PMC 1079.18]MEC4867613.1 hypothetical protein [Jaaginema sp. PMC 1078.18]
MDEETRRQELEQEIDAIGFNRLNQLGNEAVAQKLILGHGHHGGKYEILRRDEVLLLTPAEAQAYLEDLLKN